jgi:hypothetical protein
VVPPESARFDLEADLAILPVDAEGVDDWPLSGAPCEDELLSADFLFLHGYPQAGEGFFAPSRGVVSTTFPYGAMRREDDLPGDLQSFQFALDFDPANFRSPDGTVVDWLNPDGLSGPTFRDETCLRATRKRRQGAKSRTLCAPPWSRCRPADIARIKVAAQSPSHRQGRRAPRRRTP